MSKKVYVTSHYTADLDFPVEGGGFITVKPGETVGFVLANPGHARFIGEQHAGLYTISETQAAAKEVESQSIPSASSGPAA